MGRNNKSGTEFGAVDRSYRFSVLAKAAAKRMKHGVVGTEHLFIVLLEERNGVAGKLILDCLKSVGKSDLTLSDLLAKFQKNFKASRRRPPRKLLTSAMPQTVAFAKVLELADSNAIANDVATTGLYILDALIDLGAIPAFFLEILGMSAEELRRRCVVDKFPHDKEPDVVALGYIQMAQAMLRQGKIAEARVYSNLALAASNIALADSYEISDNAQDPGPIRVQLN